MARRRLLGGGAAAVKASRMQSIRQTIELLLVSDLNIKAIASEHGISIRYLQKLFKETGTSFSNYVRGAPERIKTTLLILCMSTIYLKYAVGF